MLNLNDTGTEALPIMVSVYGDGASPVFSNPNANDVIRISGSWNIVEKIRIQNSVQRGVRIETGAHNIVRDNEITAVGHGVGVYSQYNLITNNYIHDLHMIVNTPGGDDDAGAVGVVLFHSDNEISYNRFKNCIAPSYDYGTDGGAFEIYAYLHSVDNSYIHHNYAENNNGFFESGGTGFSVANTRVAYNIVKNNNGSVGSFHLNGTFGVQLSNFRLENNTVIESNGGWMMFWFSNTPSASTLTLRNNIISASGFSAVANTAGFTHDHNLFQLTNTQLGFTKDTTELLGDPLLRNITDGDYHLQRTSQAIDRGASLGYGFDFENKPVPYGQAVDIGALEYYPETIPTATPATLNGDANGDGFVDGRDFSIWVNHYGQNTGGSQNGDFDFNNTVDGRDYIIWLSNYGK
jgi:hypothetical protein